MDAPTTMPGTLRAVALLVAAEGAALAITGVVLAVRSLVDETSSVRDAEILAGLALVAGVALLLLGRALGQRRAWARSPVLVCQLLAIPVGLSLVRENPVGGVPLLLLLGAVIALLFAPATSEALGPSE